jgi:hypothetical protein
MNCTMFEFYHDPAMSMVVVEGKLRVHVTYVGVEFITSAVKTEHEGAVGVRCGDDFNLVLSFGERRWGLCELSFTVGGVNRTGGHCGR